MASDASFDCAASRLGTKIVTLACLAVPTDAIKFNDGGNGAAAKKL